MKRKLISLICIFSFASFLTAEDFHLSHLSMEDGLSSNSIYCMIQDSYGYIWFGTLSGLNRYDGRNNILFRPQAGDPDSISGSVIFSLLEDSRKNLWVGTDGGGLNLFNRETLSFSHFYNDPSDPHSLSSNQVFALEEDKRGRLWIGTAGGGLSLYKGEEGFSTLNEENSALIHNRIRTLFCDDDGVLWIGTEKGLSLYDTERERFISGDEQPDQDSLAGVFIRCHLKDGEDRLWLGTTEGLFLYQKSSGKILPVWMPESVSVRSLTRENNRLWVGTERSGIFLYDFNGRSWTHMEASGNPGELSYGKIRSLYRDNNGLIWIGTRGGGVDLYNPDTSLIKTYTGGSSDPEALKNTNIRQMIERRDGSIWIATDGGGISILDRSNGRFTAMDVNPGDRESDNDHVSSLMEDRNENLWIGTDGAGLYFLEAGKTVDEIKRIALRDIPGPEKYNGTVWSILEDHENTVWIGMEGDGLFSLKEGVLTNYAHEPDNPDSLNGNAVRCIYEDSRKQLWIGTWDGGLNLLEKETGTFRSFVRSGTSASSLSDNSVNVILEDSLKRLWVGTSGGGISIFLPPKDLFHNISTREGLSGDNVFGLLEDESRNIWVSTGQGLSRITPEKEEIQNYSRADGLISNEFSQNAFLKTADGTLFWGGPRGISSFNPKSLPHDDASADVVITQLSIHNLPVGIGSAIDGMVVLDRDISLKEEITLPYTANNISFRFAILSYIDPSKHHYAAQLTGLDERPRFLGNHNEVSYASLPPGEYVLKIFGTDHNGLNLSHVRSLGIHIKTPFWMNRWFHILSTLLFLSLAGCIVWLRVQALRRNNEQLRNFTMHMAQAREEERKAAAREYHDELGQQLTAMKFDLFWLNGHPEAEENVRKEKISTLLALVNDSIASVRTISTNLRPKVLDNLSLKEALEWKSRRFTKRTSIPVDLDIQMSSNSLDDPGGEYKTSIFRMFQEILTNIIRHAEASAVELLITQDENEFRMMVRDNGKGINKSDTVKNNSFGLIGMRERCRHLNGSFLIDNHPEGGTVVRIILPLKEKHNA